MREQKLNRQQQIFVDAVSLGKSHRDAAVEAGYSLKSASVIASKLLNLGKVQTALQERQEYYRSISDVQPEEVIGAHKEMAFASIEDALDDNGRLDFAKAKANGSAKLIKKISRQQTKYGETVAVEFYSRTEALGQLTDILGLKQAPRDNSVSIESALKAFNIWSDKNPSTTIDAKLDAIRAFATGGKVDERELARVAGVEMVSDASH